MALFETQEDHEVFSIVGSSLFVINGTSLTAMLLIHGFRLYQDLYTKKRISVSHRRDPPKLRKLYKLTSYLAMFSLFSYWLEICGGYPGWFSTNDNHCRSMLTWIFVTYQTSKSSMYLLFLSRLYMVYKPSAYSYSIKCIRLFSILLILFWCAVVIALIIITEAYVVHYDDPNYPNLCLPSANNINIFVSTIIFSQDIIVAVGFLWAFMSPLRKTIKAIAVNGANTEKVTRKIAYAGTKVTILTIVSTSSTILLTVMIIMTGYGPIGGMDCVVNAICILLMTPYYPDNKYYKNMCCCCMKCCDKRGREDVDSIDNDSNIKDKNRALEPSKTQTQTQTQTQTGSLNETQTQTQTSIDTMSQLRVTGKTIKGSVTDGYTNNKIEMQEPIVSSSDYDNEMP